METVITCGVITDGREPQTIARAIRSLSANCPPCDYRFIIDDSAREDYMVFLDKSYSSDFQIIHHPERRGLGGAIRSAWTTALQAGAAYLLHVEDDFLFAGPVDLAGMQSLLDSDRFLAQVSLKRQPVNDVEARAGGFMQAVAGLYWDADGYVQSKHLFSFNPCLIPRRVMELAVSDPPLPMLERDVTDRLLEHGYHFGVYGTTMDPPRVHHIGDYRSAGWSL